MDQAHQPLWRHPGFLLLYSIGATMLAIVLSAGLSHIAAPHKAGWWAVVFACSVAAIFVAIYVAFCRFVEGRPAREFALAPAAIELPAGIVAGLVLFSLVVGVIAAFGGYRVIGYRDAGVLVPALAVAILSGFSEEIFFRGFFFASPRNGLAAGPRSACRRPCSVRSISAIPMPPCSRRWRSCSRLGSCSRRSI